MKADRLRILVGPDAELIDRMVRAGLVERHPHVARAELATAILHELDRDYARVCGGQFAELADEWEQHCTTIGQQVVVSTGARRMQALPPGRIDSIRCGTCWPAAAT